jgi:membrane fusion protein, adhesin transport system
VEEEDGIPHYIVRLTPNNSFFQQGGYIYKLYPGVEVTTSILIGERTVLQYLTEPFLAKMELSMRER